MTQEELDEVLARHKLWLYGYAAGQKANLRGRRLSTYDFQARSLSFADLTCATLDGCNLIRAFFDHVILRRASLRNADLTGADLNSADLCNANLCGAKLEAANLWGITWSGSVLAETCCDPVNIPNAQVGQFAEREGDFVFGYRTRVSGYYDCYRIGRYYAADVFSTADTECHPGLYLWPSLELARCYSGKYAQLIRVRTKACDVHQAGSKWRCRWFEVMNDV